MKANETAGVEEFIKEVIKATQEGDLVWDVGVVEGKHESERVYSSGMILDNGAVGNMVVDSTGRMFLNSHEYREPAMAIAELIQVLGGSNPRIVEMATEGLKQRMCDAECGSGRSYSILND